MSFADQICFLVEIKGEKRTTRKIITEKVNDIIGAQSSAASLFNFVICWWWHCACSSGGWLITTVVVLNSESLERWVCSRISKSTCFFFGIEKKVQWVYGIPIEVAGSNRWKMFRKLKDDTSSRHLAPWPKFPKRLKEKKGDQFFISYLLVTFVGQVTVHTTRRKKKK